MNSNVWEGGGVIGYDWDQIWLLNWVERVV